jgi:hypothetical protein
MRTAALTPCLLAALLVVSRAAAAGAASDSAASLAPPGDLSRLRPALAYATSDNETYVKDLLELGGCGCGGVGG